MHKSGSLWLYRHYRASGNWGPEDFQFTVRPTHVAFKAFDTSYFLQNNE